MTEMHGEYITLIEASTSTTLLRKLDFLRAYAKQLTDCIRQLEATDMLAEFRGVISKQAFKAFFLLADTTDELSEKLVASSRVSSATS